MNNRFTENGHVKTNLVHKIHRIHDFGTLSYKNSNIFLSPNDYAKYKKNRPLSTWYPLTTNIFVVFIYKVSL